MYRGTVSVVKSGLHGRSGAWGWMLGSTLAAVVVIALEVWVVRLVPLEWRTFVHKGILGAFAVAFIGALGYFLKPRPPEWLDVNVDQNGIFTTDGPLIHRQDILQAYIRPALASRRAGGGYTMSAGYVPGVQLPKYPLTVEMATRKGQVNLDPGGEAAAVAVLTALGIPVTMCAPDYRQNAGTSGRQWVYTVVVVVVFLGALFGYSYYMTTHH